MSKPITIDPDKIAADIAALRAQLEVLEGLQMNLTQFEKYRVSAPKTAEPKRSHKAKKPIAVIAEKPRNGTRYDRIRDYVLRRVDDFTGSEVRDATGINDRHVVNTELKKLIDEKILIGIAPAQGRRPAVYRKVG